MAKMFYSLEEAAERLGKSADEVQKMAESGELQEFRDRDKLMFKRDQIDLLAGDDDEHGISLADSTAGDELSLSPGDTGSASASGLDLASSASGIDLAASASGIDLASSATGLGLADSAGGEQSSMGLEPMDFNADSDLGADSAAGLDASEQTGISIFDADDTEDADPAAQTNIEPALSAPEFATDAGSSGSGLLDLTRESDDTSLGGDLLDDVYGGDTADETAGETMPAADASNLFETPEPEADDLNAVPVAAHEEVYDPAGSALGTAMGLTATVAALLGITVALLGLVQTASGGRQGSALLAMVEQYWLYTAAGLGGLLVVSGVLAFVLGSRAKA
ncbi:MAG: helix-turn-helix domain-containing protein [Planctomycetota bacterium]